MAGKGKFKEHGKSEKSPKQIYMQLQKKFKLPDFDSLNFEFELSSIECEPEFFLRNIIKKISDRLNFFQETFSNVLNPDIVSLSVLHESKFFNEKQKEHLFSVYRQMALAQRKCLQAEICLSDECCAKIINDVFPLYPSLKKETQDLAKKLKEIWEKHVDAKEQLGYFG